MNTVKNLLFTAFQNAVLDVQAKPNFLADAGLPAQLLYLKAYNIYKKTPDPFDADADIRAAVADYNAAMDIKYKEDKAALEKTADKVMLELMKGRC